VDGALTLHRTSAWAVAAVAARRASGPAGGSRTDTAA
jgi:hypothetical protein